LRVIGEQVVRIFSSVLLWELESLVIVLIFVAGPEDSPSRAAGARDSSSLPSVSQN
jgi:hypothetical protein